ncbi:MarR family transcriptional regulator [Actinosynnema sp. NPDC020468]|uniref:MarR family winged helix-turn-helix transcriptional regulator n=1 Tax=Actinosynnema sp. NPDC020468 TaxID=3154488 RepID=UPI0033D2BC3E
MEPDELDVEAFTTAVEAFSRYFIRIPLLEVHSFTTLSVLDTLANADKPLRLTALARTEQVSQPGITQLVTRLEREDLVRRGPDPDDGRVVLVHITEAGRRIVRARHDDRARHLAPVLAALTAAERRALAEALPTIARLGEVGRAGMAG